MPTGLEPQALAVGQIEITEYVSIQEAAAATGVFLRVAGEAVVFALFVDRTGRVVVVLAVVDIIIEGTATQYCAVVVLAQNQLTQRGGPVGGQ